MKCWKCGLDISEEAISCPACGADISGPYWDKGPSTGRFGRGVMYLDWALRWTIIMVIGFLFAAVLLGISFAADSAGSGLMRVFGLLFLGAGLLGAYVTYLNLRKKNAA